MVEASFGRGSKSGGFVSNTYNVAADGFQFKPERSTNYEAGIKSTLAGGKATINLTIFRTEFDNLQQSAYDPDRRTFFTRNAAKARSQGFEAALPLAPSRNFQLKIVRASCRARVCQYVSISVDAV